MKKLTILCFLFLSIALPMGTAATDQTRPVVDMIIADVNGDLPGFLDRMNRVEAVAHRLGLPATLRILQATFAGPRNGEIYLLWELPSFNAFADAETKLHQDSEFLAILDEMGAAGQGFSSELLAVEITLE